ncbi:unnamed protein product [Blepharisma stoltei]|uniref:SecY-independent transporter protein n=1 Tax=Blepharisma stoltei TaxID=1481888 RepID=A0AAU9JCZ5_9CILI|nr:unnamed protein product [Blepharisma stoltei]
MHVDTRLERWLKALKFIGWAGVVASTILAALYLEEVISIWWSIIVLPLLIPLIIFPIYLSLNFTYSQPQMNTTSEWILMLLAYNGTASLRIFLILSSFLLDELIDTPWTVVFIPFWYLLFIYLAFCIYICPGLTHKDVNMKIEAFLLFGYLCGTSVSGFLFLFYADQWDYKNFYFVFIPLWVVCGIHLFLFFNENRFSNNQEELVLLGFLVSFTILITLCVEISEIPPSVAIVPLFLLEIVFFISEFLKIFEPKGYSALE